VPRIDLGKTDDAPFKFRTIDECSLRQDHAVLRALRGSPMTPSATSPAMATRLLSPRHDPTDARTRRPLWTYEHEVMATPAGPTAVLQCGETGEGSISVGTAAPFTTVPRRFVGHSIAEKCFSATPTPSASRWSNPASSRKKFSLPGARGSKRWTCSAKSRRCNKRPRRWGLLSRTAGLQRQGRIPACRVRVVGLPPLPVAQPQTGDRLVLD
jgi:hypothetical protein